MGARMLKCLGFGWQFCIWLWAVWGFIVAFGEHSCADPTISHMLGSAVLAQLVSTAVTRGHFCTDRQVPQSSNGYKYSCVSVIPKPILNHQKVISTHVFSMLGLANVLFLDCLRKKNLGVLKGTIDFLSTISCEGALKCLNFKDCASFVFIVVAFKRFLRTNPWVQPSSNRISFHSDAMLQTESEICLEQF